MSESAKHIVEGRRVEQCFYTRIQYGKCNTTDKPDASRASDDEHLESSSTATISALP